MGTPVPDPRRDHSPRVLSTRGLLHAPASFEALATRVFPRLVRGGDGPIRLRVPACGTGEDVYGLAMALVEYLGGQSARVPLAAPAALG